MDGSTLLLTDSEGYSIVLSFHKDTGIFKKFQEISWSFENISFHGYNLRIVRGYETEKAKCLSLVLEKYVWQWNGGENKEGWTRGLEINEDFDAKKGKCK